MKYKIGLFIIAAVVMFAANASAGEKKEKDAEGGGISRGVFESPQAAKINEAVAKGVAWLKTQQKADGSWAATTYKDDHFTAGLTALTLLALIKGGADRNDPAVQKGMAYMRSKAQPSDVNANTYTISLVILVLEAYHSSLVPQQMKNLEKSGMKGIGEDGIADQNFKKSVGDDMKYMKACADWLVAKQVAGVWRYPQPPDSEKLLTQDASNAQYAMLALSTARQRGIAVPKQVYEKVINYFLSTQEGDGPDVEYFPVPGADLSILELKKTADKVWKELAKIAKKNKGKISEQELMGTTVDPYEGYGAENRKMKARGWSYIDPKIVPQQLNGYDRTVGSMTASGIAALVICKAALEEMKAYEPYKAKVDQSIRDGMAWLAKWFTVERNPTWKKKGEDFTTAYHYYYLYGLERAGVLSATRLIGGRDWYEEGAAHLLGAQKPDGSWPGESHVDPITSSCFAVLFLQRATTAIVKLPESPYTGEYIGKGKKDAPKKEEPKK
jgi:hypothetical protein